MPPPWPLPPNFDGEKFQKRYNLREDEYFAYEGKLFLNPGVNITDDPPILEQNDTPQQIARKFAKKRFADTTDGEVLRAVVLTLVDEINVLRALNTPPLQPLTAAQVRNRLLAKLDSGDAD